MKSDSKIPPISHVVLQHIDPKCGSNGSCGHTVPINVQPLHNLGNRFLQVWQFQDKQWLEEVSAVDTDTKRNNKTV